MSRPKPSQLTLKTSLLMWIAVMCFGAVNAAGQNSATAEQAIQFIKEKLDQAMAVDGEPPVEITIDKTTGILVVVEQEVFMHKVFRTRITRLDLAKSDPSRVKVEVDNRLTDGGSRRDWYDVHIKGTDDKVNAHVKFDQKETHDPDPKDIEDNDVKFALLSSEDANRVVKAFQRLIELYGGKRSLF